MTADRLKILIVDDEPEALESTRLVLEAADHVVIMARDGLAALDLAERERPDLIILDLMMPMMSGFQVAEELRRNPPTHGIPVICLTAARGLDIRARARQSGACDALTKPCAPERLLAAIARWSGRVGGRPGAGSEEDTSQ